MRVRKVLLIWALGWALGLHGQKSLLESYLGFSFGNFVNAHRGLEPGTMSGRPDFFSEFAPIVLGDYVEPVSRTLAYTLEGGVRYHRLNFGFLEGTVGLGDRFIGYRADFGDGAERVELTARTKFFALPVRVGYGYEFSEWHMRAGVVMTLLFSPKGDAETVVWAPGGTAGHQRPMSGELFYQKDNLVFFMEDLFRPLIPLYAPYVGVGYNFGEVRLALDVSFVSSSYPFRDFVKSNNPFGRNIPEAMLRGWLVELGIHFRIFR
ncbi:hypothetical protein AT05_03900 [Schleiferia thermophila str. Yellowstone]|jgi:hypothetical protein|uniref:hypothetical protein n=1 Tax=Schleiferia thermophila TaxID=884107 RepID=UPI0004E713AD|nr:hypothetical protein [Schleiferia thermophila]KFD39853.1 hypothetical protein AT05_03900 [Schleiferia thermophila str. Yellowstone]